jgi:hypothetical protein
MPIFEKEDGVKFGWQGPDEPTEDDFKRNGQYCISGLAFNSA